jgi:hypothetical protein
MSDELDVLMTVVSRLETAGIAYMVSGSMALNYYAQPRMTRDIDIVVEVVAADAARLSAAFSPDFYCDADAVRDAIARRTMFNIIHSERVVKVDLIVRKESPYRRTEFARRRQVQIDGGSVSIVAPEDLLLSKLSWAKESRSELQLKDARNLIACAADLDWPYVERWAADLGVTLLLAEVRT